MVVGVWRCVFGGGVKAVKHILVGGGGVGGCDCNNFIAVAGRGAWAQGPESV